MSAQLLDTPSKHSWSLTALADNVYNGTMELAFKTSWGPLAGLAEKAVVSLMERIVKGQLTIVTPTKTYTFPVPGSQAANENAMPELKAQMRVLSDSAWIRMCTMSDLGFSEAYMYGEVECDDLISLFKMFIYNRDAISGLNSSAAYLFSIPARLTSYRFINTLSNSRSNISAHYDISNKMFEGFLSKDMTYSCAIYSELDADLKTADSTNKDIWASNNLFKQANERPAFTPSSTPPPEYVTDDLYSAQMRKLHHIIDKARIRPGHRILEIGSGWGSMAIAIARRIPDTQIDSLTLSVAQRELAMQRIEEAGLSDRIRIHLCDYRDMPAEWKGTFDRLVSVEMMEAIGKEFMETYWEKVNWALNPKTGMGCVQCITLPEARFDQYCREVDFIRKWIFPGGFIPTLTFIMEGINKGSKAQLTVESISNIGPHYSRTLREWRQMFLEKFDDVIAPALKEEYPEIMKGDKGTEEAEVFKRKWIYYYCYCEVGFTTRYIGDHIITFTRDGSEDYGCAVYE